MKFFKLFWRTTILIITILIINLANMNKVLPKDITTIKYLDKIVHLCMYLALSFIFFLENYSSHNYLKRRWIIIETISLGIFIEFLQFSLTSNRTADLMDAIFNTIGVLTGGSIFIILKKFDFVYKMLFLSNPHNK